MKAEELKMKVILNSFIENVISPNNMKCLVVGSLALHILGMEMDEPHDIDLEVVLDKPEDENIFKTFSTMCGNTFFKEKCNNYHDAERSMENVTWTHKPYIFTWQGVEINVWIVSKFSHKYITLENGLHVAEVMSVIRKKVAYNRKKDIKFCNSIAQKFLSLADIIIKNS